MNGKREGTSNDGETMTDSILMETIVGWRFSPPNLKTAARMAALQFAPFRFQG